MLVVELEHAHAVGGPQAVAVVDRQRERRLDVVGDVALAHQEQREVGLGPRQHDAPYLERVAQAVAPGGPLAQGRDALVHARVVGHIAAAS